MFSYVFKYMYKVDCDSNKFIHAPMFTYNEVMWLLELTRVVECE